MIEDRNGSTAAAPARHDKSRSIKGGGTDLGNGMGRLPPNDAFWSLTMGTAKNRVVPNPLDQNRGTGEVYRARDVERPSEK
jgi:hypothetical protein